MTVRELIALLTTFHVIGGPVSPPQTTAFIPLRVGVLIWAACASIGFWLGLYRNHFWAAVIVWCVGFAALSSGLILRLVAE